MSSIASFFFHKAGLKNTIAHRYYHVIEPFSKSNIGQEKDAVNMAESERFELSIGDKPYTPLAGARLQPLGQLSVKKILYAKCFKAMVLKTVVVSEL
jgi:hypothetical protein